MAYLYTCSFLAVFTVCCVYLIVFWELLFVWTCVAMSPYVRKGRHLEASVYLRALPLVLCAQVCLVFVSVHRSKMYI